MQLRLQWRVQLSYNYLHWCSSIIISFFFCDIQTQDNNEVLAYWLSNASTLLLLLQRTLKASGSTGMAPQRRRSSSATLFGRMTQVYVQISAILLFCSSLTKALWHTGPTRMNLSPLVVSPIYKSKCQVHFNLRVNSFTRSEDKRVSGVGVGACFTQRA